MATPSQIFTELVTTTDRNWGGEIVDNMSNHNALIRILKKTGRIKKIGGGYELVERLAYAENTTYQRFDGYDALTVDASDVITSAHYPLRNIAIFVTSSGSEIRKNSGKEAMINLAKSRMDIAMKTAVNQFSVDLYSDGTLAEQINGLANIIQNNGQGTVGGINSTTHSFWRNKFLDAAGPFTPTVANSVAFKGEMNRLHMALTRGTDKPDLIVMTHDFYSLYEVGEQDKQRYADSELANAGFQTLKYKSADVVFDDNANFSTTGEKAYFLNTEYLKLCQHREASWTPEAERKPTNQDAVIIPILWMGNLVCSNRALQGVLFDS